METKELLANDTIKKETRELLTKATTNKPYKEYYTVYRPNDPRIQRLRQEWYQNGAPPMTSAKVD